MQKNDQARIIKNTNKIRLLIIVSSGFFLLLDQFLKWQTTHNWNQAKLINKYFGWQPFLNSGAAFSLPMPNWLVLILSFPIIALVTFLLIRERRKTYNFLVWTLILTGAISNFFDRLFYQYVIDYFAFITGIINLGDILIVSGLILYLLRWKNKKFEINYDEKQIN